VTYNNVQCAIQFNVISNYFNQSYVYNVKSFKKHLKYLISIRISLVPIVHVYICCMAIVSF